MKSSPTTMCPVMLVVEERIRRRPEECEYGIAIGQRGEPRRERMTGIALKTSGIYDGFLAFWDVFSGRLPVVGMTVVPVRTKARRNCFRHVNKAPE